MSGCRRHKHHHRPRQPEDFPIGMLVNQLSKFFGDYQRIEGEKVGIRESFRSVVFHLRREGGISQYELAGRCQVKPSSMSATLRSMEEEGYIRRVPDEKDQRLIRVYLTDAGIALDDQVRELIHQTEGLFCSALSEDEAKQLKTLLAKIYKVTIGKEDAVHEETNEVS